MFVHFVAEPPQSVGSAKPNMDSLNGVLLKARRARCETVSALAAEMHLLVSRKAAICGMDYCHTVIS